MQYLYLYRVNIWARKREMRKSILLLMFAFQNFLELLTSTYTLFLRLMKYIEALNEVIGTFCWCFLRGGGATRGNVHKNFLFGVNYTRKCLILGRKFFKPMALWWWAWEMIWEAKGRKKDEKVFHNACVENIFYIRTFSALEIFSAFFSLAMQCCITQKMIAVHNEQNDDVNRWHVVCVCLYVKKLAVVGNEML